MNKDLENWIYRPIYPEEDFFKRIEAALGFKLFIWQKTFILMGAFRQYGATTAEILRELLNTKAEPLDYTKPAANHKAAIYRKELREIQGKLQRAGIETREVFWSEKDKSSYYWKHGAQRKCESPDCKNCPFPPCGERGGKE